MWAVVRPLALIALLIVLGAFAWRAYRGVPLPGTMPPPAPAEEHDNGAAAGFKLEARVVSSAEGSHVALHWTGEPDGAVEALVYRSTRPLDQTRLNLSRYPIAEFRVRGSAWVDDAPADHVVYSYQVATRGRGAQAWQYSTIASAEIPDRPLPALSRPSLRVDKSHYVLEACDGGRVAKRYPIALGRNPVRRKLHQDNASTPEGVYHIASLQPNATYYRAYDIDYPNDIDRMRYDLARDARRLPAENPPIGGEIQIHGRGIDANWTYGCMALRNSDMDELFSHPEIAAGTSVIIAGTELRDDDLRTIADTRASRLAVAEAQTRLGALGLLSEEPRGDATRATMKALGDFQLAHGLPLTCDFDARTVLALRATR